VADEQDRVPVGCVAAGLDVHLGHERAGRVDRVQTPCPGVLVHRRRHTVGRKDHRPPLGNIELVLDEDRAASLEVADDMGVVDDLLANVNGRPVQVEELLDRVDGPFDPGAIAAGRSQKNPLDHNASVVSRFCALIRRSGPVCRGDSVVHTARRLEGRERRKLLRASGGAVSAQKQESPPLGGSVRRASQIAHRGLRGQVRNRGSHRPVPRT
jgi:hypothetical protein